ncbi:MAG: fimbrillin family protein [Marinifilaceae bacterium]
MKPVLYTLCALIGILSCNTEWDNIPNSEITDHLSFEPQFSETKGTPLTATTLSSIGIFGYHTVGGTFNSVTSSPNLLNNKLLSKSGTTWSYTPLVYWSEIPGDYASFFAYAPYATPTNGIEAPVSGYTQGTPSIKYTIPKGLSKQVDLMVATSQLNRTKSQGIVPLNMKHTLTKLSFSAVGTGTLNKIEIVGVKGTGTLSLMTDGTTINWSNQAYIQDAGVDRVYQAGLINPSGVPVTNTIQNVTSDSGFLMMIPQTFDLNDTRAKLKVYLNGSVTPKEYNIVNLLSATPWLPGQSINCVIMTGESDTVNFIPMGRANCYMLNPLTDGRTRTFRIPIDRVNTYWGDATYGNTSSNTIGLSDNWTMDVIWSDIKLPTSNIVISKSTGTGANPTVSGYFDVKVASTTPGIEGNILVGIKKTGSSVYLWSWHLWITAYRPNTTGPTHVYNDGLGGDANYGKVPIWSVAPALGGYLGKRIMDRNVGAFKPGQYDLQEGDELKLKGALYYQYGRKDPFPSKVSLWNGTGSTSILINNGFTTVNVAINNPKTFNKHPTQWCSTNFLQGSLWADNHYISNTGLGKSIFDPCPPGWRLPINGTWSNFSDGNGTYPSNVTLQPLGSLTPNILIYQPLAGAAAVYPFAGMRDGSTGDVIRNYKLSGVTYWLGAMWSSSMQNDNFGSAFIYTTNGADPSLERSNPNGMPVRCIQE